MTKNKKAKRVARSLGKTAGLSYTAARRATANGGAGAGGSGGGAGGFDGGVDAPDEGEWDGFEPISLTDLVRSCSQGECDRLIGDCIRPRGDHSSAGISVDFDLPDDVLDPSVHQIDMDESTVEVQIEEEFEGGTLACTVTAAGTLTVEGLMLKADAYTSEASELVEIFEADFNEHYSTVIFRVDVEATFLAIVNPDYEGVEDFRFDGAIAAGP